MKSLQVTPRRTWKSVSGNEYKILLIPAPHYVSLETMELWAKWVKQGLPVYFLEHMPLNPNSFGLNEDEKTRWQAAKETLLMRWISDPINVLERFKINRESIADLNLSFLRKRSAEGAKYFIANLSKNFSEGMINLSKAVSDVEIEDPLTGKIWKEHLNKQKQFFMSLAPGQSVIVRSAKVDKRALTKLAVPKVFVPLEPREKIMLSFPNQLVKTKPLDTMAFWTADSSTHDYWGKATYAFDFDLMSEQIKACQILHLDQVRDWVRVKINGQDLGIVWSLPYQMNIPKGVLKDKNHIELEVMNVSANRIRKLDREKTTWKNFYEINFVDIQYKPFDASNWGVTESGLKGELYFSNR
jgi:hypothetical protein